MEDRNRVRAIGSPQALRRCFIKHETKQVQLYKTVDFPIVVIVDVTTLYGVSFMHTTENYKETRWVHVT